MTPPRDLSDREADALASMMGGLEHRVETLEREIEQLRDELDERIVVAAHRLRDDSGFIIPFWKNGAGHMGEHLITMAGRKVFLWIVTGLLGALLMWAGSTRFWAA